MQYLYLHGFMSGKNSYKGVALKERFARHGHELLTPDLNGDDFEKMTITSQLDIIRNILSKSVGPVTLIGSSLGGYLSLILAEENLRIDQLILLAPAVHFLKRRQAQMGPDFLKNWKENGSIMLYHFAYDEERPLSYDIIEDAEQYEAMEFKRDLPALVMHGQADDTVPVDVSLDYFRAHPQSELLLLHTDHQFTTALERIWEASREFLNF